MTDNCNADILAQARANVIERNNYAHRNAILRGEWDAAYNSAGVCVSGTLMHAEIARLLREPEIVEGSE